MPKLAPEREASAFTAEFVQQRMTGTARFHGRYTTDRIDAHWRSLLTGLKGKRILEYGCGKGETLDFLLAQRPSVLEAVDIAPEMVEIAQAHIEQAGASTVACARVMDAHNLDYADDSFDVICGMAILHHLDLNEACRELKRVLAPGGFAVFLEPLGYNPAINIYRKFTPQYRTSDEHPLVLRDLRILRLHFEIEVRYFIMTVLLSCFNPFRWAAKPLVWLDNILLRLPLVRCLAWAVVLKLRPKSS
jgi:SAM-dependent methyltransferase